MSVCVYVCVTLVVFTDCRSCTRPISTNLGSMEAGEYGLTRGTCFVARRLAVVAVTGLLWISWCVLGGADFFVFSMSSHFQIGTPRAISIDSVKGLRQPANLPTENSRPPIPTRCTVYCAPTREIWRPRLISKLAHSIRNQSHRNNSSSFEIASCHCSRDRELRQTYARGTSSHVF